MTYFEARGVEFQYNSKNIYEAEKFFEKSCNKCITKGMHIDCDRCAIANVHSDILEILTEKRINLC